MSLSDLIKKVTDSPRRLKEGAEEIGEKVEKAYHEKREKPAIKDALARQKELEIENEAKFKSGKISEDLYKKRSERYAEEAKAISKPVEQRIAKGAVSVGRTFGAGLSDLAERSSADIKPIRGGSVPRAGKGSRTRIKSSSRGGIDFSTGSAVNFGSATKRSGNIDFSQPLFGSPQKKQRK